MPMYPKTVGECVTVKIKNESQPNGGRMHLDDQLAEMLDIMLPVGELKTFATDEVDAWISKMAAYNQVWVEPDGSLLKKSDYPDLFTLIGYKYGWSNSNPNGTYTHTFTDVDGNEKSLVLYNDLDIDGNAKAVSGSPAYFRLPNFAGRFLRCAGTATYANKWADTDGNEHEVLTTYTAEMYKGKLDAQRDICRVQPEIHCSRRECWFRGCSGKGEEGSVEAEGLHRQRSGWIRERICSCLQLWPVRPDRGHEPLITHC